MRSSGAKKGGAKKPAVVVPERGPVPVTLLSGFLGAGKTTLLEHILKNKEGLRCAVIVNDMAEINIDASLVKGTKLLQTREKMVELHNGCICCTLREDLLLELRKLALSNKFDVIVIESTGVSEPMQVAETFFMDLKDGKGLLNNIARLDNCVTVVDASSFFDYLTSLDSVGDKWQSEETTDEDDRDVSKLLVQQVEFATLIVLNKVDLVDARRIEQTQALLKRLNPTAHVVTATRSTVDLNLLLFTQQFTHEYAERAKGWMADIESGIKHTPETLEYGIGSFVYRATTPFHPRRLYDFITSYFMLQEIVDPVADESEPQAAGAAAASAAAASEDEGRAAAASGESTVVPEVAREDVVAVNAQRSARRVAEVGNVFRSKGYIWIGSPARLGSYGEWSQAGNLLQISCGGGWGLFPDTVAVAGAEIGFVEKTPCQELVIIGQDLNREAITARLDACLLTAEEQTQLADAMASSGDAAATMLMFGDPFEPWTLTDADKDADWEDADDDEDGDGEDEA